MITAGKRLPAVVMLMHAIQSLGSKSWRVTKPAPFQIGTGTQKLGQQHHASWQVGMPASTRGRTMPTASSISAAGLGSA